ncbi:RTA-like protein [Penicillium occitanis (nom. inval.)]|nr:RTA-like protein [Penicillium occitanis (nom. inval.)]PCG98291.1 hypothetical protein PENOC_064030 [Penicillium occitanis (nom. inval.)]
MTVLKPYKGNYYLWYYVPSLPAAIILLVTFIVATTFHIYRLFKTRTWFCIPFCIGGIFEIYGFVFRCTAHNNTSSVFSYALANNGVLLAPALFAASIYMTLGRLLRFLRAEHLSLINVRWLTKIFVIGDCLSFVVQASSVGLSITGHDIGAKAIVIVGLLIQIVSFGVFGVTTVVFHRRIPLSSAHPVVAGDEAFGWKKILYMLYYTSILVMIRSIFRLVEYSMGNNGYPLRHEWTMYVFDVVLMVGVMVVFYVWHPSSLRVNDKEAVEGRVSMGEGLVHNSEPRSTAFTELVSFENKR